MTETAGQILERAAKAKAILENPLYRESWELTHQALLRAIEEAPLSNTALAEDLRRCLKLLRQVRANFETALNRGKAVQFRLEAEQKRRARIEKGERPDYYR